MSGKLRDECRRLLVATRLEPRAIRPLLEGADLSSKDKEIISNSIPIAVRHIFRVACKAPDFPVMLGDALLVEAGEIDRFAPSIAGDSLAELFHAVGLRLGQFADGRRGMLGKKPSDRLNIYAPYPDKQADGEIIDMDEIVCLEF